MAAIYLRHKVHGTKVAIAEEEAEADSKRGWERYEPKEPEAKLKDPAAWAARMEKEEEESMVRWRAQEKERQKQLGR